MSNDSQPDEVFKDTPVLVAYLFGSWATGRARPSSDRDIAVLLEPQLSSAERGRWRLRLIGELSDFYRTTAIDLVVLNDAPPLLRFEVIKNRHVLYNRDDEARVAFEVRTMQEWFDWAPRYRRMQRARLQRFAVQPLAGRNILLDEGDDDRRMQELRVYLDRLAELQQSTREQLHGDWHVQAMVERNLQLAIEAIISISEQIIAALALPTPENSRLALALLADEAIIPRDLAAELQAAVGFRNIIVHQYMGIDYDIVYNALQNDLVHLESFLTAVSAYLRSHDLP